MSLSPVIAVRLAGVLAGLILVAVFAAGAWRVPASPRAAGLDVDVRAVGTGEVGVTPGGSVVRGSGLTPGGRVLRGRVRLENRTAGVLRARPAVTGGDPALDALLEVELRVAGRVAFRGPASRLRSGGVGPVAVLQRGGTAAVAVAVRVPQGAGDDAVARAGQWTLSFAGAS